MSAVVTTEIKREETFLGTRWAVYVDGKYCWNAGTEKRAKQIAKRLREKAERA